MRASILLPAQILLGIEQPSLRLSEIGLDLRDLFRPAAQPEISQLRLRLRQTALGFAHGGALLFGFQREQPGSGGDPAAALDRHALDPTGFGCAEPQVLALGIALPRLSGFAAGGDKRSEEQEEEALHVFTSWGTAESPWSKVST